ncbi:MAG: hypothetical protein M3Z48_00630 [Lactobacillus sp.]|uniref:ABC-three component system protein n=2 Tax=Bacteria TaxID=2 RepID=UPI000777A0AD|nr:ABC-three component system protein [Bacillus cereus]MCT6901718.1 hypothetical protein [Lactobacillus sp.]MED3580191.1 hypothetical protein [Bacillus thuringiensis]TKI38059.1 hypothetical protein FC683_05535 [Bacillus cereus]UUE89901.1 hypothetical protein L2I54_04735 [Bacillus cereus]
MDGLSKQFYEWRFKDIIRERTGTQYEDFFSEIMKAKYKDNFMPCKPWGREGDRKNDGYLINEKYLFAVNGPHSLEQNRMIRKMEDDLVGALDYWEKYFDKWSFVHNQEALPPQVNRKLLELRSTYESIEISFWGPTELKDIIFSLEDRAIDDILGPIPSINNFTNLTFKDIQPVLKSISRRSNPKGDDFIPVPQDKLMINGFCDPIIELIKTGIIRAPLVKQYFNLQRNVNLGDQIAGTLTEQYEHFRDDLGLDPDDIYSELVNFISDDNKKSDQIYMVAVHTVLAYFFEQCAIFESVSV